MLTPQLIATINDELRWREAELAIAKIHLQRSLPDLKQFSFSYRCFVAITYAHFEAYTKRVVAQGMQDIFNAGRPWSECQQSIKVNLFAGQLRNVINNISNDDLAVKSSLTSCLIDSVTPPSLNVILECGNMNVTNFFWAIENVGLDTSKFSFARKDVGHLAAMRHDCAHGEALTFDRNKTRSQLAIELYSLQSRIIIIMHTLAVEMIDHFSSSKYLAANNPI